MINTLNFWPYVLTIYGLTVLSGLTLFMLSHSKERTDAVSEGICLSLGATVGFAVAAIVSTLGIVLG